MEEKTSLSSDQTQVIKEVKWFLELQSKQKDYKVEKKVTMQIARERKTS